MLSFGDLNLDILGDPWFVFGMGLNFMFWEMFIHIRGQVMREELKLLRYRLHTIKGSPIYNKQGIGKCLFVCWFAFPFRNIARLVMVTLEY